MIKMVLVRHGASVWNVKNIFSGWTDVDMSPKGYKQASRAGKILQEKGYAFDIAYTSVLKRAIRTLWIILDELDLMWLPVYRSWRLNERHYGALQGLNKAETAKKMGEEQVFKWRRSYNVAPPPLESSDPRHPAHDPRYAGLNEAEIPASESLEDTVKRVLPYWNEVLAPAIKSGKRIIITSHGNSIRALVKYLDNIGDDEITALNIPTGVPLVYELDDDLKPLRHYYLADPAEVKKEINEDANQGKAN